MKTLLACIFALIISTAAHADTIYNLLTVQFTPLPGDSNAALHLYTQFDSAPVVNWYLTDTGIHTSLHSAQVADDWAGSVRFTLDGFYYPIGFGGTGLPLLAGPGEWLPPNPTPHEINWPLYFEAPATSNEIGMNIWGVDQTLFSMYLTSWRSDDPVPVPEPSTLLFLIIGLAPAGIYHARSISRTLS